MIEQLKKIAALDFGWDGYRAQPLQDCIIETAEKLIDILPEEPKAYIYPSNEDLYFEWSDGNQGLEIVIENDMLFIWERDGNATNGYDCTIENETKILDAVDCYVRRTQRNSSKDRK